MECIKDCEYIEYKDSWLYCSFYEEELETSFDSNLMELRPYKCKECLYDSLENIKDDEPTIEEKIDWLIDEFYMLKDEFEETVVDMYNRIKYINKG